MAKIVFIGSGNLATNLAPELARIGHDIIQVYSRTIENAVELAAEVDAEPVNTPQEVSDSADWYIVALSDKVYDDVLPEISMNESALLTHVAGSQPMETLADYADRIGVFYPLQTFSKARKVDFSHIPFCIEAEQEDDVKFLLNEASKISSDVRVVDSEQRQHLHLAAVFACNFVNHFYALAEGICERENISFDVLRPLIEETAAKALSHQPSKVQTGPAVRFDRNIIDKHLEMLDDNPDLHNLYLAVSESIHKFHKE